MQDFGGLESFSPSEGGAATSEQLSEEAKQRFAQSQQQGKQIAKQEKKARKRDDRVADVIKHFLSDEKYSHFFQLISRLVARDCPSIFILAILSLIHQASLEAVEEFIAERKLLIEASIEQAVQQSHKQLSPEARRAILLWTTRLELVLSTSTEKVLSKLMVDEGNMDGTVLQLTTFVLIDFFEGIGREVSYDSMQPLTIKVLQDLLEPHMEFMEKYFAGLRAEKEGNKDEDED